MNSDRRPVSLRKSDPPPKLDGNRYSGYRAKYVEKLKSDPGEWYEVHRENGWGSNTKSEWEKAFPGVEATMRRLEGQGPNRFQLWIRWNPSNGEHLS